MSTKFEKLLDYLVNEEMDKANDLFHQIVVEKSRQIYENMIAEEADEEDEEQQDEAREEDDEEADESVEEGFGEPEGDLGGDSSDDMLGDVDSTDSLDGGDDFGDDEFGAGDEFGGEGGEEPATKDDIMDVKDTLATLQAALQSIIDGEKHEEEGEPGVHGGELDDIDLDGDGEADMDEPEEDDEEADEFDDEDEEAADEQFMREYKEVVGKPYGGGKVAGKTEEASTHKVSPISKASGRPTTSATAKNITQGNTEGGSPTGTSPAGKAGGLVGNVKGEFTGNHLNKPGGFKGDAFKKNGAGHGAEKKGSGEGSANTKDLLPRK